MTRPIGPYYLMHATLFRQAAEAIQHEFDVEGKSFDGNIKSIPFMHLMLHALELLLKACLLKRGYEESDVKKPRLRHDLVNLAAELKICGRKLSNRAEDLLGIAGQMHKRHLFRYEALMVGSSELITADELYFLFDEFMDAAALSAGDGAEYIRRIEEGS